MKRKPLAFCFGLVILSAITPIFGAEKHSAVQPAHRHSWWTLRHWAVNERVRQGNVDMIFIGDSITHSWENNGKEVWKKYYERRNAVNMGFSGDRTQHVLWRLDNGNIDGISPKVAVIMIGTNNSNRDDNTAEEIADGMIAICRKLRRKLPRTISEAAHKLPRTAARSQRGSSRVASPSGVAERESGAIGLASCSCELRRWPPPACGNGTSVDLSGRPPGLVPASPPRARTPSSPRPGPLLRWRRSRLPAPP